MGSAVAAGWLASYEEADRACWWCGWVPTEAADGRCPRCRRDERDRTPPEAGAF